jgi:hypothetical protein
MTHPAVSCVEHDTEGGGWLIRNCNDLSSVIARSEATWQSIFMGEWIATPEVADQVRNDDAMTGTCQICIILTTLICVYMRLRVKPAMTLARRIRTGM